MKVQPPVMIPSQRKIVFYGSENDESLRYETLDEYISNFVDDCIGGEVEIPDKIIVCCFARVVVEANEDCVLNYVLNNLDETYGNPDGDSCEITEGMREAAKIFCKAIANEYTPWLCEIVDRKMVDLKKWCLENKVEK